MTFQTDKLLIEILSAPGCNQCAKAMQWLENIIAELGSKNIEVKQVNIVEQLDYAVSLGLQATPGIAINGELIFTSLPTKTKLLEAIQSKCHNHEK